MFHCNLGWHIFCVIILIQQYKLGGQQLAVKLLTNGSRVASGRLYAMHNKLVQQFCMLANMHSCTHLSWFIAVLFLEKKKSVKLLQSFTCWPHATGLIWSEAHACTQLHLWHNPQIIRASPQNLYQSRGEQAKPAFWYWGGLAFNI